MSFVARLRAWLSRLLRRRPSAPERYAEIARLFALARPRAGRAEWERFSVRLAAVAWHDGRGFGLEVANRAPPELVDRRHRWSVAQANPRLASALWAPDPDDPYPRHYTELQRAQMFDRQGEAYGTHRVVYFSEQKK